MAISKFANEYHEKMFSGYVSKKDTEKCLRYLLENIK